LLYLSLVFDDRQQRTNVEEMLKGLLNAITQYPTSFAIWAVTLQRLIFGIHEIAILGEYQKLHKELLHIFIPNRVMQVSATESQNFPLLKGKKFEHKTLIFLCKDFVCQQPLDDIPSLIRALEKENKYRFKQ